MDMIERVAKAIYASSPFPDGLKFLDPEPWRSCIYSARAAIEAMREPTYAMCDTLYEFGPEAYMEPEEVMAALIDAALEEKK